MLQFLMYLSILVSIGTVLVVAVLGFKEIVEPIKMAKKLKEKEAK